MRVAGGNVVATVMASAARSSHSSALMLNPPNQSSLPFACFNISSIWPNARRPTMLISSMITCGHRQHASVLLV